MYEDSTYKARLKLIKDEAPRGPNLLREMQTLLDEAFAVCEEVDVKPSSIYDLRNHEKGGELIAVNLSGQPFFWYVDKSYEDHDGSIYSLSFCNLIHFANWDREAFKKKLVNQLLNRLYKNVWIGDATREKLPDEIIKFKDYIDEDFAEKWDVKLKK